jgi:nuclear transport factor 2 (NTF2) superfamily protein
MIPCICINDKNRPKEIPVNKWIKEGQEYHVIYTVWSIPSNTLGLHLDEIWLDDCCPPYEFFKADRFAFTEENLKLLIELIKDCNDTDFSMDELLKQTTLEEAS